MNTKIYTIAIIFALVGYAACEKIPSDSEIISMIDKLDDEQSLPLFGGLSLEKVESVNDISPRSSETLTDRIVRYLKSHSVNLDNISEARSNGGKIKPVIIKKVKSTFEINEKNLQLFLIFFYSQFFY
jgi:hypothetical protein